MKCGWGISVVVVVVVRKVGCLLVERREWGGREQEGSSRRVLFVFTVPPLMQDGDAGPPPGQRILDGERLLAYQENVMNYKSMRGSTL